MDIIFYDKNIEILQSESIKKHIKKICETVACVIKINNLLVPIDKEKFVENNIRSNYEIVAKMNPVKTIYYNALDKYLGKPSEQLKEYLRSIGSVALSEYGIVYLSNKSARDIIFHSFNSLKAYGVGAIKEVLENGKAIYYKSKYDKKSDRLVIAAPINISGKLHKGKFMMGVAVEVYPASNRATLIELAIEKEPYGLLSSKMTTRRSDSPSILTLLQQVIDVKNGNLSLDQVTAIGIDS
ncbi:MAG: hypothetical protein J6W35_04780 [Eubacterium sp.]|nr:hypothetical protein [Eubacterium sp.]